jgi:2-polyprenyl-3-methyl-5-hydroxy-6-metoxy-1,4-benzoquinol methylase
MISDLNKHRFEYIWHLFNTNKTDKDLPFHKHKQCNPSIWEFPEEISKYHHLVFELGEKSFKEKTVLDIGCGIAWYLGFLENKVKKYIGVDPDVKSIKYAKIMSSIVDVDSDISVNSVKDIKCKADTIMMLGVTHHIVDIKNIFNTFDCKNIVLDCWEEHPNSSHLNELIQILELKGFNLDNKNMHIFEKGCKISDRYILHFSR